MARKNSKNSADSESDSARFKGDASSHALARLQKLRSEFSSAVQKRDAETGKSAAEETLRQLINLLAQVEDNRSLSRADKLSVLQQVQNLVASQTDRLEPKIPETAPSLWEHRSDLDENPFEFAHRVYGDAAKIMLVSDYMKLDVRLGDILTNHKRRGKPIPEGLNVLTKKERDRDLIENPPTWRELLSKLPNHLKHEFLAYKAAQARRSRSK